MYSNQEKKILAELKRLGPENVREHLRGFGSGYGAAVWYDTDIGRLETSRDFVTRWLAEHDRSRSRFNTIAVVVTIVIATALGFWAVFKS